MPLIGWYSAPGWTFGGRIKDSDLPTIIIQSRAKLDNEIEIYRRVRWVYRGLGGFGEGVILYLILCKFYHIQSDEWKPANAIIFS